MNLIKLRHKNLNAFIAMLIPIALIYLYMRAFIYLPLSEDAGFYAYMAKAVANGALLHRDISISTHSSYIYINALFFSLIEPSIFVYRIFAIIPEIIIATTLSVWLQRKYGFLFATISIFIFLVVLNNPHVTLDIGRNNHLLAMLFLWGSIYLLLIKESPSAFMAGILLGLATTVREPYVLYGLPFLLISFKQRVAINFLLGGSIVALMWSIFLISEGQLYAYLNDILLSGSKFRYGNGNLGFFNFGRIISNIGALQHGAKNFYGTFLCLAVLAYGFQSKDSIIWAIKFLLLPMSLFIEIWVNKSVEYSIQPVMIFAVILIAESLSGLKGCIRFILSKSTLGGHPNVFLFVIFMFSTWGILVANWNEYSAYFRVSKSNQNNALYDIIPLRVLAIIDSVPHKSIATNSSYPLLFLSRQLYPNRYPFVEDLSAGVNLSRDDITRSQIDTLKTNKIDIVVVKTSTEFSNTPSDFDKVLENYSLIVEFPKPSENPVIAPYAERVYFSKSLIERQFINIGAEIKNKDYIVKADGASLIKLTNLATCSVMATSDGNPHAISRSNKGDLYIWAVGAKNIKYHLTGYCGPMKILRFATNNAISDQ